MIFAIQFVFKHKFRFSAYIQWYIIIIFLYFYLIGSFLIVMAYNQYVYCATKSCYICAMYWNFISFIYFSYFDTITGIKRVDSPGSKEAAKWFIMIGFLYYQAIQYGQSLVTATFNLASEHTDILCLIFSS